MLLWNRAIWRILATDSQHVYGFHTTMAVQIVEMIQKNPSCKHESQKPCYCRIWDERWKYHLIWYSCLINLVAIMKNWASQSIHRGTKSLTSMILVFGQSKALAGDVRQSDDFSTTLNSWLYRISLNKCAGRIGRKRTFIIVWFRWNSLHGLLNTSSLNGEKIIQIGLLVSEIWPVKVKSQGRVYSSRRLYNMHSAGYWFCTTCLTLR